jgi:hypothetical protein
VVLVDFWSVIGLIVLILLGVVVQPIKIRLNGAALRRQGATKRQVTAWALAEARKDRRNPVVEIIAAMRRSRDAGSSQG